MFIKKLWGKRGELMTEFAIKGCRAASRGSTLLAALATSVQH
jgi:hypothetical protein